MQAIEKHSIRLDVKLVLKPIGKLVDIFVMKYQHRICQQLINRYTCCIYPKIVPKTQTNFHNLAIEFDLYGGSNHILGYSKFVIEREGVRHSNFNA